MKIRASSFLLGALVVGEMVAFYTHNVGGLFGIIVGIVIGMIYAAEEEN